MSWTTEERRHGERRSPNGGVPTQHPTVDLTVAQEQLLDAEPDTTGTGSTGTGSTPVPLREAVLPETPPPHAWQVQVRTAVVQCDDDLRTSLRVDADPGVVDRVQTHLERAGTAAEGRVGLADRWVGRSVETAWAHVHRARALMPLVVSADALPRELVNAQAQALAYLNSTDAQRRAIDDAELVKRVKAAKGATATDRFAISSAIGTAYDVNDRRYSAVRGWRNRLYILSGMGAAVVVGLLVLHAFDAGWFPLGTVTVPGAGARRDFQVPVDPVMVALVGALGGVLTALASVRGVGPSTSAYSLTPALALLKVPTGALTALLGVMLMQSASVPGLTQLTTPGAVAAAGLLFGASQELLTRLIDVRARAVETAAVKGSPDDATSSAVP